MMHVTTEISFMNDKLVVSIASWRIARTISPQPTGQSNDQPTSHINNEPKDQSMS